MKAIMGNDDKAGTLRNIKGYMPFESNSMS